MEYFHLGKASAVFLAAELRARFPHLFGDASPRLEVGCGWFPILVRAFEQLDVRMDAAERCRVKIYRIYARYAQLHIDGDPLELIESVLLAAQGAASRTCYFCGVSGKTHRINGQYFATCEPCANRAKAISGSSRDPSERRRGASGSAILETLVSSIGWRLHPAADWGPPIGKEAGSDLHLYEDAQSRVGQSTHAGSMIVDGSETPQLGHSQDAAVARCIAELIELTRGTASDAFDAHRFFHDWAQVPHPALGGRKPADLLSTPEGEDLVFRLLQSTLLSSSYW